MSPQSAIIYLLPYGIKLETQKNITITTAEASMEKLSAPEAKINLATLQHKDPFITNLKATAKHVNLYTFQAKTNEWVCKLN